MTCAAFLLVAACRTIRPPGGEPIGPLTSTSPAEAAQQLAALRSQFRGERSLIRVRLPQISARGQLRVDAAGRMLLTIYTPLGTTATRLYSQGDDVIFLNDFEKTAWRGKASELAGTLGVFVGSIPFLLIGLPPAGMDTITYGPAGIESILLPDATITYDPPVYPPKRVTIDRGQRHIAIEHLDSYVDSDPIEPPQIPSNYRCCVPPNL